MEYLVRVSSLSVLSGDVGAHLFSQNDRHGFDDVEIVSRASPDVALVIRETAEHHQVKQEVIDALLHLRE